MTHQPRLGPLGAPAIVLDGGDIAGFAMTTMGAIAAKLAQPERPVVVVTGDGSFGLGAMESETAWGQVKHGQEAAFGPDRTPGTPVGWRSYEKLVAALGGYGDRVDRLGEVGPALERVSDSEPVRLKTVEVSGHLQQGRSSLSSPAERTQLLTASVGGQGMRPSSPS